jgi:D-3-phosphoglycerate dehydrogenase
MSGRPVVVTGRVCDVTDVIAEDGKGKKNLQVLFLPPGPSQIKPWFNDVVASLQGRHALKIFDQKRDVLDQFDGVEAVIDFGGKLGTPAMADVASGRVRLWQILGTGFDHFDIPYWKSRGIPVANCPGYLSAPPLGDCALMFLLMLARRWHASQALMQGGTLYNPVCLELEGLRLALIGFGSSAQQFALRVRPFGMKVSAIDVRPISSLEMNEFGLDFAGTPSDMDSLIAESDCVSLHLHLDRETYHILDARRLALMKPTAFLINVARGALVDETALLAALKEGRIAGAAMDVFSSEPISPDSPLLQLPNVVATPHIAGVSTGTSRRRAQFAAANIDRIAAGLEPLARIDI